MESTTKKISLQITGVKPQPDGGIVIMTKVTKDNPSPNGNFVIKAGQAARIAARVGVNSLTSLQYLVKIDNGSAVLTLDAKLVKAGDVWVNKVTGEEGIHKGSTKPGHEGEPYMDYRNHEIELGFAASNKLLELKEGGNNNAAPVYVTPIATFTKVANNKLGVHADATTDATTEATGATTEEPEV